MSVTHLTTTMPVTRIITADIPITMVDTGRAGMAGVVIVAGGVIVAVTAGSTVVSVGSMAAVLRFAVGADLVVDMEAADMEAGDTANSPLSHA